MEVHVAYCATHDRPVRVMAKKSAPNWPSPEGASPDDLVCLEHGDTCTGGMCPIFDVPSADMKDRLEEYRASFEE